MARMAAIMCRAPTMSEHMQLAMFEQSCPECGDSPPRGRIVPGPACSVAILVCTLKNGDANLSGIMDTLTEASDCGRNPAGFGCGLTQRSAGGTDPRRAAVYDSGPSTAI